MPKIAVVILNWNGKDLLEKFLPSVIKNSSVAEIYVVDNASTDDSIYFLSSSYPGVRIVQNEYNYGFAAGYNKGLRKISADYFVLINSDVEVTENWITPIIDFMEAHKDVAACQPKILDYNYRDRFEYAGASGGFIDYLGYPFCRGRIFDTIEVDLGQYNDAVPIFWASGACFFIRSEVFHKLKGFDVDFFAHMEEIDLCWRMLNQNYKIYVVPDSKVYHVGGGTLENTNPKKTFLNFRNSLICLTKNYRGKNLFFVIFLRLLLDGLAGIKFLSSGKVAQMLSIIKSHWMYFLTLNQTLAKRKEIMANENKYQNLVLDKSIVMRYYLKGGKKFSDLKFVSTRI